MGGGLSNVYIASSRQLGAGFALVASGTFAAGTLDFTGLSGNYNYMLVLQINGAGAGGATIELNADSTTTNYYNQYLSFTGAAVSTGASNNNSLLHAENGGGYWTVDVGIDYASHPCYHSKGNVSLSTPIVQEYFGARTASTATEITEIKVIQSGTTITGTGKLYRLYNV